MSGVSVGYSIGLGFVMAIVVALLLSWFFPVTPELTIWNWDLLTSSPHHR